MKTNMELVADELNAAKQKHPHFIDRMTCLSGTGANIHLEVARDFLGRSIKANDATLYEVLMCEFYEAIQAYAHGDLANAKRELAQCAAVCVRAMEYVQQEMEKTK